MPTVGKCPICRAATEKLVHDGNVTTCLMCGSVFELIPKHEMHIIHKGERLPAPTIPKSSFPFIGGSRPEE